MAEVSMTVASNFPIQMLLRQAFASVLNSRLGMRVHQPTLEELVARLSIIQQRGLMLGRGSGGVSFNDPRCGICTEGFGVFFSCGPVGDLCKDDLLAGK